MNKKDRQRIMIKLDSLRDDLIDRLKTTASIPSCGAELYDWAKFDSSDAELLELALDDEEKLREWIFDICLKSGRFELTEDGSDLRIK